MPRPVTLGVDVGGTKTRVALLDGSGAVIDVDEEPTGGAPRADPGLRTSFAVAQRLAVRATRADCELVGVGVGVPEFVDPSGRLRSSLVVAWDEQPMHLFASIGPTVVESDVRCGALAEAALGAGVGAASMLYVSVGTGISCALVLEGRLWAGHRGEAIALGELPVDRSADPSSSATLEEFASGGGIGQRHGRGLPARAVLELAASGDESASAVVQGAAAALGAALAWAVSLVDPERIVLGGGLGTSGGTWLDLVRRRYEGMARPGAAPIEVARLGADSGVIGAALAARPAR